MTEAVREVRFAHFRGLPEWRCTLGGKNLLILGGNGTGKSAVVDGIEFIFSGTISRFQGVGTGGISPVTAIKHVGRAGDPLVAIALAPSNATVTRELSSASSVSISKPVAEDYLRRHGHVESFVLRRTRLLEFISAQDADRYQKFLRLLGLDFIDATQKSFLEAEELAGKLRATRETGLKTLLAPFADVASGWTPRSLSDLLKRGQEVATRVGVPFDGSATGVPALVVAARAKRPEQASREIDSLNRALVSLETPFRGDIDKLSQDLADSHAALNQAGAELGEAGSAGVIREGLLYFGSNLAARRCPLCEQELLSEAASILQRLKDREAALAKLREAQAARTRALNDLLAALQNAVGLLELDQANSDTLEPGEARQLRDGLLQLKTRTSEVERCRDHAGRTLPDVASTQPLRRLREAIAKRLAKRREQLMQPAAVQLENDLGFLERLEAQHEAIGNAEASIRGASAHEQQLGAVRGAFSKAREKAVQGIFDAIAAKVVTYYRALHEVEGAPDSVECSSLQLVPTSRAQAGGLKLTIGFLGRVKSCDPRAFLSEGHLDSLGLAVYLASVKMFNAPETLLVLDDVLTSVDREHRHRAADLLLEEFSEYQLLVTTHDERWFNQVQDKVAARGETQSWRFQGIARWTLDTGPESAMFEGTWGWIEANLRDESYRELGGPLRVVLEDFLKRVAEKMSLNMPYRVGGAYTAGDFAHAGIQGALRTALVERDAADEAAIKADLSRVFGTGNLVNFLSHDNPGRLEVTLTETHDFVTGLKSLTKRCQTHKLIKGAAI